MGGGGLVGNGDLNEGGGLTHVLVVSPSEGAEWSEGGLVDVPVWPGWDGVGDAAEGGVVGKAAELSDILGGKAHGGVEVVFGHVGYAGGCESAGLEYLRRNIAMGGGFLKSGEICKGVTSRWGELVEIWELGVRVGCCASIYSVA